jgi:hypothetical protein
MKPRCVRKAPQPIMWSFNKRRAARARSQRFGHDLTPPRPPKAKRAPPERRTRLKTERAGFEPAVGFNPYDGLANRSYRPLRHLSTRLTIADLPPKRKPLGQDRGRVALRMPRRPRRLYPNNVLDHPRHSFREELSVAGNDLAPLTLQPQADGAREQPGFGGGASCLEAHGVRASLAQGEVSKRYQ